MSENPEEAVRRKITRLTRSPYTSLGATNPFYGMTVDELRAHGIAVPYTDKELSDMDPLAKQIDALP